MVMHEAQSVLGFTVPSFRCLSEPLACLTVALSRSTAVEMHDAQPILGFNVSPPRRLPEPLHDLLVILLPSLSFGVLKTPLELSLSSFSMSLSHLPVILKVAVATIIRYAKLYSHITAWPKISTRTREMCDEQPAHRTPSAVVA